MTSWYTERFYLRTALRRTVEETAGVWLSSDTSVSRFQAIFERHLLAHSRHCYTMLTLCLNPDQKNLDFAWKCDW